MSILFSLIPRLAPQREPGNEAIHYIDVLLHVDNGDNSCYM